MNKKVFFILEIFWLIVGILGFATGVYETNRNGLKESWVFFMIAAVGLGMYFMRRNLRKKTAKP